jgi:hypothetical protein
MDKKKSGRITLRVGSPLHARVTKTAKNLGLDINGLLNLMIRERLGEYEARAALFALHLKGELLRQLYVKWLSQIWVPRNPNKDPEKSVPEFTAELQKYCRGEESSVAPLLASGA